VAAAFALRNNWDVIWRGIKRTTDSIINGLIGMINGLIRAINIIPGVNIDEIGKVGPKTQALTQRSKDILAAQGNKMAGGGLITEPTLLSSLRTGRPYGIAGEAGTEVLSPAGAGVVNNFSIAQLIVRETADVQRIARELYVMQKMRLRGAGG